MNDLVIICDEIMDAEAKSCDEEAKTIPTNFNERKVACKTQNCYFNCIFINYYKIINSSQYLLLSDKTSSKIKAVATISSHK